MHPTPRPALLAAEKLRVICSVTSKLDKTASVDWAHGMNTPKKMLMRAAASGDVAGVVAAVAAGADIHAKHDRVLCEASAHGYIDVVKVLLDARANVNTFATTPLRRAAFHGHTGVVRILLAAGADVHSGGEAALRWAAVRGHTGPVCLLLAAGANPLVARLKADDHMRSAVTETLDACADDLTPAQRLALTKESDRLVHMRATPTSSEQQHRPQR